MPQDWELKNKPHFFLFSLPFLYPGNMQHKKMADVSPGIFTKLLFLALYCTYTFTLIFCGILVYYVLLMVKQ